MSYYSVKLISVQRVDSLFIIGKESTHPETAVHSWHEHDSRQDNQTGDEEADHQAGAADDTQSGWDYIHIKNYLFISACVFNAFSVTG